MPKLPKNKSLLIILLVLIFLGFAGLYIWGWSKSNYKCFSWSEPIRHPLSSNDQVVACRVFSDLSNQSAFLTQNDVSNLIANQKKMGKTFNSEQAVKVGLGRKKIELAAQLHNISVSDSEVQAALKGLQVSAEAQKQEKGYLLQQKLKKAIVAQATADLVLVRWDWRRPEDWQAKITSLRNEAKNSLATVRDDVKKGTNLVTAVGKVTFDSTKFAVYANQAEKLVYNPQNSDQFKNIVTLPKGISTVICDNRLCGLFNVKETNNGKYNSFDQFMEGLQGW